MKKQSRVVEAGIADKIIEVGDAIYDIAEEIPGVDWAAKLGRMTLSDNKYIRAMQIVGAAVGLTWGPLMLYNMLKNISAGGEGSDEAKAMIEKQLMKALKKAKDSKPMPIAASFPAVKNPKLRARLLRVGLSVEATDAARKLADNGLLSPADDPEEDEDEDEEAVLPALLGVGMRALAPAALSGLMGGGGGRGGGGAGGATTDMQASAKNELPKHREEDEDEDEEAEESDFGKGMSQGAGSAIGGGLMQGLLALAESEDEDEEAGADQDYRDKDEDEDEESCGMDDGSYPAGPRNDANKSRYRVEPAHGQGTVDLLRFTANLNSLIDRIETVANG